MSPLVLEIKPALIRRLIPLKQEVTSLGLESDALVFHTSAGDVRMVLHSVTVQPSASWFGLKRLVFIAPNQTLHVDGVSQNDAQSVQQAITDAHGRESKRQEATRSTLVGEANQVSCALADWEVLVQRDAYLTFHEVEHWMQTAGTFLIPSGDDAHLIEQLPENNSRALRRLSAVTIEPHKAAEQRNASYVQKQLQEYKPLFDTVESKPLTEEQRHAVVHDEDNALVVAGAGTGKTSAIVAKVGYLLHKGWAKPEEILLLAFTNKAAEEMRERLKSSLGIELRVRTFHALGLEIIAEATQRKPSLCAEAEDPVQRNTTLSRIIESLVASDSFRTDLLAYQAKLRKPYKAAWEFKSEADYTQYRLDVELRTFAGSRVRSYEECEIANWLFVSGIRFDYEHPYEFDTTTSEYGQYKPDFYLPDYGIYIEHWGIDKNGRTAPFVAQGEYEKKMEWARELHTTNGTKLVETFSWERMDDTLLSRLETKLRECGVTTAPISRERALQLLNAAGIMDPFCELVGQFLTHFKSSGSDTTAIQVKTGLVGDSARDALFLRLFGKIHAEYERLLHGRGEVDFEDMIMLAQAHVQSGKYSSPFRYLLVDEFQDIAIGRANLLKALRDQVAGAKLFCVGDDWQSIYRFAGGDLSLTTEFDKNFGFTRRTTLSHTFRFYDTISRFSSRFVQKNPGQLRKELSTETASDGPGVVVRPSGARDPLTEILREIEGKGSASVLLLTRYGFRKLDKSVLAALKSNHPTLDIRELTVHASKGMEADYVIVRDLSRGKHGFPSEIPDDPVLAMVLPPSERFPFAEERRLFYVALTRAKKRVYLVPDATNPSVFVQEILGESAYLKTVVDASTSITRVCPHCTRGQIVKRRGPFREFYGCSNYPICTYIGTMCPACKRGYMADSGAEKKTCVSCGASARVCPGCGTGVLEKRFGTGSGRPFWGCSNYGRKKGSCTYTEKMYRQGAEAN